MSRQARILIPAIFLTCTVVFSGCKTVYSDRYSPRRNHFIPVKEKPKPVPVIAPTETTPLPGTDLPGLGLPPAAPPSAPAPADAPAMPEGAMAPTIPGL